MDRTNQHYLFSVGAPFIYVGVGEPERSKWLDSAFYSKEGLSTCVRRVRGHKMRDHDSLMNEFAAAFQFFDGFGENWPALNDCLTDLEETLPADAYVVIVERAEEVLVDDVPVHLTVLLDVLNLVGEAWAEPVQQGAWFDRPSIPFHVLFLLTEGHLASGRKRFLAAAAERGVPIRL